MKKYWHEKVTIVVQEGQSLLPEQQNVLENFFQDEHIKFEFNTIEVPAEGWTKKQMDEFVTEAKKGFSFRRRHFIVFAYPVPYLMVALTRAEVDACPEYAEWTGIVTKVLHYENKWQLL